MITSEQTQLLRAQLIENAPLFYEKLANLEAQNLSHCHTLLSYFEELYHLAIQLGLTGFSEICQHIQQHIQNHSQLNPTQPIPENWYHQLEQWPKHLANYLDAPNEERFILQITDALGKWMPITPENKQALTQNLQVTTSSTAIAKNINQSIQPKENNQPAQPEKDTQPKENNQPTQLKKSNQSTRSKKASPSNQPKKANQSTRPKKANPSAQPTTDYPTNNGLIQSFPIHEEDPEDLPLSIVLETQPAPDISLPISEIDHLFNLTVDDSKDLLVSDIELQKLLDETTFDSLPIEDFEEDISNFFTEEEPEDKPTVEEENKPITEDIDSLKFPELSSLEDILRTEEESQQPVESLTQPNPAPVPVSTQNKSSKPNDSQTISTLKKSDFPSNSSSGEIAQKTNDRNLKEPDSEGEMVFSQQTLTDLSNKIVEVSDTLATSLNQFITHHEESEQFLEALERYTNTLQIIWEASGNLNLQGFQQVCTFISDNFFESSNLSATKKLELRDLFAAWPKLALDYLQTPTKGAALLTEHLTLSTWPQPFTKEKANFLLTQLIQETLAPQDVPIMRPPSSPAVTQAKTSTASNKKKTVAKTRSSAGKTERSNTEYYDDEQGISEDNLNLKSKAQSILNSAGTKDILEELEEESDWTPDWYQDTDTPYYHTENTEEFTYVNQDRNSLSFTKVQENLTLREQETEGDDFFTDLLDRIPDREDILSTFETSSYLAESETHSHQPTLKSILETKKTVAKQNERDAHLNSSLETEMSIQMTENTDNIQFKTSHDPDEPISFTPQPSLERDHQVSQDKLPIQPNQSWQASWSEEKKETGSEIPLSAHPQVNQSTPTLKAHNRPTSSESQTSKRFAKVGPSSNPLKSADIIDSLTAEFSEASHDLSKALNQFAVAEDDSAELLEAMEQYHDNVQAIAEAAKKVGLITLSAICEFINENIFEFSTHPRAIRRTAQFHLETWPYLLINYLQNPTEGAQKLVNHLKSSIWPLALSPEQAHALFNELLGQSPAKHAINLINRDKPVSPTKSSSTVESEPLSSEVGMEPELVVMAEQAVVEEKDIKEGISIPLAIQIVEQEMPILEMEEEFLELKLDQPVPSTLPSDLGLVIESQDSEIEDSGNLDFETAQDYFSQLSEGLFPEIQHFENEQSEEFLQEIIEQTLILEGKTDNLEKLTLADPDIIEALCTQLLDLQSLLAEGLLLLIQAPSGSAELLNAVEIYTEHVQSFWEAAELAYLEGVQQVCTLVNSNVMALGSCEETTRIGVQNLLGEWTQLTLVYLQQPTLQSAESLLNYLKDRAWAVPLTEEEAVNLYQNLTRPSVEIPSVEPERVEVLTKTVPVEKVASVPVPVSPLPAQMVPDSLKTESDSLSLPKLTLATPDVIELVTQQLLDLEAVLQSILNDFCQSPLQSEELLNALGNYTEQVQTIWEIAELSNLKGLQTVCDFINQNVMALGEFPPTDRLSRQPLLATWLSLVLAYVQDPINEADNLLAYVQETQWPSAFNDDQVAEFYQQLIGQSLVEEAPKPSVAEACSQFTPPTGEVASPANLQQVHSHIINIAESLSSSLEVCISMDSQNPALLEAIESYTNQVQTIWEVSETAGLAGLQEVCTFVNENLMALAMQESEAKLAAQPYFEQWPAVILAYLESPLSNAQAVVELLQVPEWPVPLAEEKVAELLNLLTQSSTSDQQVAAYQAQVAETGEVVEFEEDSESAPELVGLNVEETGEISLGNAEVLGILTEELHSSEEDLTKELERFTSLPSADPKFVESAENYADQVQRLNLASEMLGLAGLQGVCSFIVENVKLWRQQELPVRAKAKKLLETWPSLVLSYLESPMTSVIPMLNYLREPQWAKPLGDEAAHELLGLLTQGSTVDEEAQQAEMYNRPTQANPEDVLLRIPPDVNKELLEAYLQEVPQHAADFSVCIQNIIVSAETAEVERAQRIAHTLKGSSNIIGIKGIASIAHHLEDTLEYLAQHKVVPPKALTETMVEAADCIEMMVDALMGQDEAPPQAQQVLQSVLDWANRIDKGNLQAGPATTAARSAAPAVAPPKVVKSEATAAGAAKPSEKVAQGTEVVAGSPEQVLRVPTKTVDNLMRLVGELSISLGQIQEKLKHVLHGTRHLTEQELILQQKTFALENLVDVRGVTGVENRHRKTTVQEEDFDPLEFEEYNELHSVAHSFIESIADNRELAMNIREDLAELETMFIHQQRLSKEFESSIMTTRMVPVNTIVSKLQRNVRQTCRTTGKKAELEMSGIDLLIDSDVLNNLADPLQHILRNAIDHGLELPDERTMLGKVEEGKISLSFYREGNNMVVSCRDDGQGLNYTNIRYTAIQKGIIKENQELSEAELGRLILMSGFSTKSGVTQVSGRGVGMDVVHTNIRQMKGTLDLQSETGKGTTILIKLPMTLVTLHVLLVRVGKRAFGIPTNHLEQALAPGIGEFQMVGETISLKIGKGIYAIKTLGGLLHVPDYATEVSEEDIRPIILVREETGTTAVMVDELIDTHDLVMKSMGKFVKNVHGVSGAAILGNGSLVPLLDLPELLRSPMQAKMSAYLASEPVASVGQAAAAAIPNILVVDDSLSVRKSLSLLLEDAGFEISLAKDGLEAIEVINQKRPNVMLVDMEMPRMNGLELTAHVRANQSTQNLPIFMITSRTTEKHREQAKSAGVNAYLTKPYQDTELLGLIDRALSGQM